MFVVLAEVIIALQLMFHVEMLMRWKSWLNDFRKSPTFDPSHEVLAEAAYTIVFANWLLFCGTYTMLVAGLGTLMPATTIAVTCGVGVFMATSMIVTTEATL